MGGKILKYVLVLVPGLLCALVALYWYGSRDLPDYDDRGLLALAQANPARGFNGFEHLDFLTDGFKFPLSDQARDNLSRNVDFNEWSLGEVVTTLSQNQAYIQSFIYASDQAYVEFPVPDNDILHSPPYDHFFYLARLLELKVRLLLASGNVDAAIDHSLAPLKFASLMMRDFGPDAFLSYVVGGVMQSQSLALLQEIAASNGVSEADVSRLQRAVEDLPGYTEDGFDRVFAQMFARDLGFFDDFSSQSLAERWSNFRESSEYRGAGNGETLSSWIHDLLITLFPRYFMHENRQRDEVARVVAALAAQHDRYCLQLELPPPSVNDKPLAWLGDFSPDAMGTDTADYGKLYDDYLYRRCLLYTEREVVKVRLAFERHRLARGEYPGIPGELVPGFLSSLPRDYFDGEQLRYSTSNHVLYSVGENGVDDGGNAEFAELGYRECGLDADCRNNPTFALPALQ